MLTRIILYTQCPGCKTRKKETRPKRFTLGGKKCRRFQKRPIGGTVCRKSVKRARARHCHSAIKISRPPAGLILRIFDL